MTVTIDLGERWYGEEPEPQPPTGLPPRAWRTATLALCVLVLLLAGGATWPADPFPRRGTIAVASGGLMYVDGDRSYLVSHDGERSRVDAYDVRDGARLWSAALPVAGPVSDMWVDDGRLSLRTDAAPGGVAVFDLARGRPVWSAGTMYLRVPERSAILVAGPAATLALVDADSGAPRWTVPFGGCVVAGYAHDPDGAALAVVARCGNEPSIRVIAVADGRTIASRPLSALVPHRHGMDAFRSLVAGDMLVIDDISGGTDLLVGIRLADLTPQWSEPPPMHGEPPYACGNSLCQNSRDGLLKLDPRTGRGPGPQPPTDPSPVPPAVARLSGPGPTIVLNPNPSMLIVGDDVLRLADETQPLPAYVMSARVWVAVAEPDARAPGRVRVRVLGELTGVSPGGCFATLRYLACATTRDQLTFYALPSDIARP